MTQYIHELVLRDGEMIALKTALKFYQDHCKEQLKDGAKAPFWAHDKEIDEINNKISANYERLFKSQAGNDN